jgi:PPOX class probable F420-dependent enzyme
MLSLTQGNFALRKRLPLQATPKKEKNHMSSHSPIVHQFYEPFQLPDKASPAGESIARQLHDEPLIWLTTVDEQGTPQPLPVAFVWDEVQSTLLIYSAPEGERDRLAHIRQNPRVALHFDGSGKDIIVITGEAFVSPDDPPSDQLPAWVGKYQDFFTRLGMTLRQAAAGAPVALRIRPLTLRYVPTPTGTGRR